MKENYMHMYHGHISEDNGKGAYPKGSFTVFTPNSGCKGRYTECRKTEKLVRILVLLGPYINGNYYHKKGL